MLGREADQDPASVAAGDAVGEQRRRKGQAYIESNMGRYEGSARLSMRSRWLMERVRKQLRRSIDHFEHSWLEAPETE